LTSLLIGVNIEDNNNIRFHPEQLRDWPDDAAATPVREGANSNGQYRQMKRNKNDRSPLLAAFFCCFMDSMMYELLRS
jgi:hypothetical protein